uniref:SH3 domain-containing protein n=1 Tax=Ditylenchus dipsaci TaxID=166011 RepID=A0A915ETD5_9BILA
MTISTRFSATSHAQSNGGGPVGVLSEKMKSLSLDCAEMPPPVNASMSSTMRSPFKSKPMRSARGFAASGEGLDWERSVSPTAPIQPVNRRLPLPAANGTHVVIHEYVTNSIETALFLGDRLHIVDNGDPDWLHGFKINDRLERLLTFPATCVTAIQPGEQPMKLIQNCNPEKKVRLYRDQVVFAQPDSIREDSTILIRNEHRTFVYCPLQRGSDVALSRVLSKKKVPGTVCSNGLMLNTNVYGLRTSKALVYCYNVKVVGVTQTGTLFNFTEVGCTDAEKIER